MKAKIILFEDEKDVRESIIEILVNNDFEAITLKTDTNFLERIIFHKPDLIISDIMMPIKNGFDVFKEVKSREETQDIPFIFLTAKSDYNDIRIGMALGADDYILKPFKVKDLLRSIELRLKNSQKVKNRLNDFSSNVALHIPHELRTPLIALLGYSDMMLEDYSNLTRNEILSYIQSIKNSSLRLHRIIEKFILYNDILLLELDNKLTERFFSKVPTDASKQIKTDSLNTALRFNRKDDLILILEKCNTNMTEEALSIIITQLLENAFKYSAKDSKVEVKVDQFNSKYFVSIKDYGIGMTKEQIENISAFQQFNRGLKNQSGNGLGVVISQKILSLFDSRLIILSSHSNGTTAKFQL